MRMMSHRFLLPLFFTSLILLAAACTPTAQPKPTPTFLAPTPTPLPGASYVVKKGTLAETLDVRGRVVSLKEQSLFFSMSGWIKTINIQPGAQMEKGEVIAELDVPLLVEAVEDAKYRLDTSRLNLKALQESQAQVNDLQVQQSKLQEQLFKLRQQDATSDNAKQQFAIQEEIAKLDTSIYMLKQKATQTDIEIASREIEYREQVLAIEAGRLAGTRLEAPFFGVVISLDKSLGDDVKPFESIGLIADPTQLQVEATVLEGDIDRIALDQPIKVILDAFPLSEFSGKVAQIGAKPTLWQGKQAFPVIIRFNEPNAVPRAIRMGADISITTRLSANALFVPTKSIFTEGNRKFVEVYDGDKTVRINVETGISNKNQTEILRGLEEGTVVRVP